MLLVKTQETHFVHILSSFSNECSMDRKTKKKKLRRIEVRFLACFNTSISIINWQKNGIRLALSPNRLMYN